MAMKTCLGIKIVLFSMLFLPALNLTAEKEIRVGVYQNEPKIFVDSLGEPKGIFIDILQYIAKQEAWRLVYVYSDWKSLLHKLSIGEIDLLPDIARSAKRDSLYSFNRISFVESWLEIVTLKSISIPNNDALKGKTVAVLEFSFQEEYLKGLAGVKEEIKIKSLPTYAETVNLLIHGQVDAILVSRFFQYSSLYDKGRMVKNKIIFPTPLYFASTKNRNNDILNIIDIHLTEFKTDPKSIYYRTLEKWHDFSLKNQSKDFLTYSILGLVLVIGISLAFVLILRREVLQKTKKITEINNDLKNVLATLTDISETTPVGIFRMCTPLNQKLNKGEIPHFQLTYTNNLFRQLFGFTSQEIQQNDFVITRKMHYDDLLSFILTNQQAYLESHNFHWEGRFIIQEELKWFRIISIPKRGTEDDLLWTGIVEDITVNKQTEEELRKSENLFHSLAEISPVGIFRTRPDGYTTYVNARWCELSGLSFQDAMGWGWLKAVNIVERDRIDQNWKANVEKKAISTEEYRFVRSDGSFVWVLGYAVPEIVDDVIIGYIGTITDITERKNSEVLLQQKNAELKLAFQKAEESDKLKSSFLANISHEIRTPMNAVCGFSHLLKDVKNESLRQEYLNLIISNSHELMDIINDLVDLSAIDTNQVEVVKLACSVNQIIDDSYDLYAKQSFLKGVVLKVLKSLESPFDEILTDGPKIKQTIQILLTNAIKNTHKGKIEFGYTVSDCCLEFFVSDTGKGIPKAYLDIIFQKFRQIDSQIFESRQGTGMGLAIAKAYIELLGGKIWVQSEEGSGSNFYFRIPYTPVKNIDIAMNTNKPIKYNWAGKTVLLVEDDQPSYVFLKCMVESTNAHLLWAKTGKEALDLFGKVPNINLVLLDIKLPDISGLRVVERIRSIGSLIPVIAQTAYALTPDREKAIESGCNEYLTKPLHREVLFEIMNKYL